MNNDTLSPATRWMKNNAFCASLIGHEAEQKAKKHLEEAGLKLIAQNYQCVFGEVDLIFQDSAKLWVFVEVKYRQNADYGRAEEYFTASKRSKVVKASVCYLLEQGLNPEMTALRIDVVAINKDELNWIKNV